MNLFGAKPCTVCKAYLPYTAFRKIGRGYSPSCRMCTDADVWAAEHKRLMREWSLFACKTEAPETISASNTKLRYERLKRQTPGWVDWRAIQLVYDEAEAMRALGLDVHVDHYFPIAGKTVSGLHVAENLRVILASDNFKKGNKFPVQES